MPVNAVIHNFTRRTEFNSGLLKVKQNYYPFGMSMPGRSLSLSNYRFGFNKGSEKDNEVYGPGNLYTTEWRELDSRLGGRWWSVDRIVKPWESSYAGFANNPIYFSDPRGLDDDPVKKGDILKDENGKEIKDDKGNLIRASSSEATAEDTKPSNPSSSSNGQLAAAPKDKTEVIKNPILSDIPVGGSNNLVGNFFRSIDRGLMGNGKMPFGIEFYSEDGKSKGEKPMSTNGPVLRMDAGIIELINDLTELGKVGSNPREKWDSEDVMFGQDGEPYDNEPQPVLKTPTSNDIELKVMRQQVKTMHKIIIKYKTNGTYELEVQDSAEYLRILKNNPSIKVNLIK